MIRPLARAHLLLASALVIVSCTADSTVVITVGSPDGLLDCGEGETLRSAGIFTSGEGEQQVVEEALAGWLEDGARLANPTETEAWSAVVEGNEIAIAVPEQEGDGSWVVADVSICGEPNTGPAEIDGSIDCAGESYWQQQATMDAETPGEDTPERAVRLALEPYRQGSGGEIVMIDDNTGSLVIDDREQVVASAIEVPAGGWAVSTMSGCAEITA